MISTRTWVFGVVNRFRSVSPSQRSRATPELRMYGVFTTLQVIHTHTFEHSYVCIFIATHITCIVTRIHNIHAGSTMLTHSAHEHMLAGFHGHIVGFKVTWQPYCRVEGQKQPAPPPSDPKRPTLRLKLSLSNSKNTLKSCNSDGRRPNRFEQVSF